MSELETVTKSLREYALKHPLDVFKLEQPHKKHYRDLTVSGHRCRICFTYQVSDEIKGFILSVYSLDSPKLKPSELIARRIADAIFPGGDYMDGDALNINVLQMSRKFIQFKDIKAK